MSIVGVTGTRKGLSAEQKAVALNLCKGTGWYQTFQAKVLHHGDCVGVDVQLATLARAEGISITGHPPVKDTLRAHFKSDTTLETKDDLARNRDIVDACEILWAFPDGPERKGSGTWYTINYAKKQKCLIVLVHRNGVTEVLRF